MLDQASSSVPRSTVSAVMALRVTTAVAAACHTVHSKPGLHLCSANAESIVIPEGSATLLAKPSTLMTHTAEVAYAATYSTSRLQLGC